MVRGTKCRRKVIPREVSRALVLNPVWLTLAVQDIAREISALDYAFALIQGHPPKHKARFRLEPKTRPVLKTAGGQGWSIWQMTAFLPSIKTPLVPGFASGQVWYMARKRRMAIF